MTAEQNQDFVTYVGNAVSPIFTVRDSAGVVVDISTVSAISWTAQRNLGEAAVITKTKAAGQITFVTNGTDGKFKVAILGADTAALSGYYIHQATITDSSGNPTTVTVGRMQVGQAPVWTYDPGQISTSALYQVRRLIGDVLIGDQQLSDPEVLFAISQYSGVYLAAAECCRQIAAQYARKVDLVQGELKTNYSNQAKAYMTQAVDLEQRGLIRGGGAMPYAGGISVTDKGAQVETLDRVSPQFNIGMTDNMIPTGVGSGNETPGNPSGGNGGNGGAVP